MSWARTTREFPLVQDSRDVDSESHLANAGSRHAKRQRHAATSTPTARTNSTSLSRNVPTIVSFSAAIHLELGERGLGSGFASYSYTATAATTAPSRTHHRTSQSQPMVPSPSLTPLPTTRTVIPPHDPAPSSRSHSYSHQRSRGRARVTTNVPHETLPIASEKLPTPSLCQICLSAPPDALFLPCAHLAACTNCTMQFLAAGSNSSREINGRELVHRITGYDLHGTGGGGRLGLGALHHPYDAAPKDWKCPLCRGEVRRWIKVYLP